MIKIFWESGPDYCEVTRYEVVVGFNPGKTGHTDNAGACSHAAFLEGEYQDLVREKFGETVLEEVKAAIRGSGAL